MFALVCGRFEIRRIMRNLITPRLGLERSLAEPVCTPVFCQFLLSARHFAGLEEEYPAAGSVNCLRKNQGTVRLMS